VYNPNKESLPGVLSYAQGKAVKKEEPVKVETAKDEKKIAPTPLDKSKAPRANVPEVLATAKPATSTKAVVTVKTAAPAIASIAQIKTKEDPVVPVTEDRKKEVTKVQKIITE
jgi:hypothetical protein